MKKFVPVMASVPTPQFMEGWIAKHYALPGRPKVFIWSSGINVLYRVLAGGRAYFLRIAGLGGRSAAHLRFELEQLRFLHHDGVAVAAPLAARDGSFFLPMALPSGTSQASLFVEAPALGQPSMDERTFTELGIQFAGLHRAQNRFRGRPWLRDLDEKGLVDLPLAQLRRHRASFGGEWGLLKKIALKIRKGLALLPKTRDSYGLIHADPHLQNMNYDSSRRRFVFFDFDGSRRGWRLFDLATFFWSDRSAGNAGERRRWLCLGYSRHRKLLASEIKAIPLMMAARHLWWMGAQAELADQLSHNMVTPQRHAQKMGFLKWWHEGSLNFF